MDGTNIGMMEVLKGEERMAENFPESTKDNSPQIRGQQIPNWEKMKRNMNLDTLQRKFWEKKLMTDYLQKNI